MKKTFTNNFFLVAIILLIFSYYNSTKGEKLSDKEKHNVNSEEKKDCDHVHWSYHKGKDGPENWKNLCDGFKSCGGEAQSPINIKTDETVKDKHLTAIKFNYNSTMAIIENNGHTVQFYVCGNNTIMIDDKEYELLQFHYHAKSEHTINGKHYPIEVHFVHRYSNSDLAVLGIMFQEGKKYDLFTEYLSHFPVTKGHYVSENKIELNKLFPTELNYYNYNGSLTTPPCDEVVNWYVLKSPLEASKKQIEKFSKILNGNFRPVMPLNGRKILSFEE